MKEQKTPLEYLKKHEGILPKTVGLAILCRLMEEYSDQQNAELRERVKELEGEVNRTIDNLHMEIHVMITDARIAVTKLGISPDKSEAVDRLLYDFDVLQGKMMDALKTEEKK